MKVIHSKKMIMGLLALPMILGGCGRNAEETSSPRANVTTADLPTETQKEDDRPYTYVFRNYCSFPTGYTCHGSVDMEEMATYRIKNAELISSETIDYGMCAYIRVYDKDDSRYLDNPKCSFAYHYHIIQTFKQYIDEDEEK